MTSKTSECCNVTIHIATSCVAILGLDAFTLHEMFATRYSRTVMGKMLHENLKAINSDPIDITQVKQLYFNCNYVLIKITINNNMF